MYEGIMNLHVAFAGEDGSYGAPVKVSPLMDIDLQPKIAKGELYGDNARQRSKSKIVGYSLTASVNDIALELRAKLLGHLYDKGQEVVKKSDEAPKIAVAFEFSREDNAKRMVWLYNGRCQPINEKGKSADNSITFQTPTITIEFSDSEEGLKYTMDSDATDADETIIKSWYDEVKVYKAAA